MSSVVFSNNILVQLGTQKLSFFFSQITPNSMKISIQAENLKVRISLQKENVFYIYFITAKPLKNGTRRSRPLKLSGLFR